MRQLQMQATSLRTRIDELSVTDPSILHCTMNEIVGRYPELRSFATNMADAAAQSNRSDASSRISRWG